MNAKRQEILKLCEEHPRTARELVQATGERTSTVHFRLYELLKTGALQKSGSTDTCAYLYQAVPGWERARRQDRPDYQPLGICVWGVWM